MFVIESIVLTLQYVFVLNRKLQQKIVPNRSKLISPQILPVLIVSSSFSLFDDMFANATMSFLHLSSFFLIQIHCFRVSVCSGCKVLGAHHQDYSTYNVNDSCCQVIPRSSTNLYSYTCYFFVAYLHLSLVLLVETLSILHEKLEPKVIVATSINPELVRGKFGWLPNVYV